MAWTAGVDRATGDLITATIWNSYLGATGSLMDLRIHQHGGADGAGDDELTGIDHITFDDIATPAAPGASKNRLYSKAGVWYYRAGAAGAETSFGPTSGTAPGASTLGGSASAGTDGTYSRDGHAHAITATTSEAFLGADVALTVANTWYDGPSLSLGAGTWLVEANVAISGFGTNNNGQARLWDGTTDYATGGTGAEVGYPHSIPLAAIITLGSTTTIKVSCATDTGGEAIDAALGNPAAGGNKLSSIRALKLAA